MSKEMEVREGFNESAFLARVAKATDDLRPEAGSNDAIIVLAGTKEEDGISSSKNAHGYAARSNHAYDY